MYGTKKTMRIDFLNMHPLCKAFNSILWLNKFFLKTIYIL